MSDCAAIEKIGIAAVRNVIVRIAVAKSIRHRKVQGRLDSTDDPATRSCLWAWPKIVANATLVASAATQSERRFTDWRTHIFKLVSGIFSEYRSSARSSSSCATRMSESFGRPFTSTRSASATNRQSTLGHRHVVERASSSLVLISTNTRSPTV
jgi:hypothetical protein